MYSRSVVAVVLSINENEQRIRFSNTNQALVFADNVCANERHVCVCEYVSADSIFPPLVEFSNKNKIYVHNVHW